MYPITKYTRQKAKKYGVTVRPSTLKLKKIDVFRKGQKISSVGYLGMSDYPTYLRTRGKRYADGRRKLYYQRHSNDGKVKGTNGWWAKHLLW